MLWDTEFEQTSVLRMKSQRFDKYKGKYLRETKASQSLSSLIQDSFMFLVQLVWRGGGRGSNMPMATIEEYPSTLNPLTLTIMFLIQKEMSPIFLQRNTDFMIRFQPTVTIYI